MNIAGIVKTSLIDFPGLVSCVLFTPGCNFDCFYCHNRHLLGGAPAAVGPDTLMTFLKKRAGQLDGVVLTGGEPTLQADLIPFLSEIKSLGYKLKLDTNGALPEVVESLLRAGLCDYIAVDYKAPARRYRDVCRGCADAEKVLRTIRLLQDSGAVFEVRTTVIPQLEEADLLQMAEELPVVPLYTLNRYRKPAFYRPEDEELIEKPPYTQERIAALAEVIRPRQPNVRV